MVLGEEAHLLENSDREFFSSRVKFLKGKNCAIFVTEVRLLKTAQDLILSGNRRNNYSLLKQQLPKLTCRAHDRPAGATAEFSTAISLSGAARTGEPEPSGLSLAVGNTAGFMPGPEINPRCLHPARNRQHFRASTAQEPGY